MSASPGRAVGAIAFELVASLENYEQATAELVATWLDMERYQSVSRQIDHMRLLSSALPQVSVSWVGLLVSHTELVYCLWKWGENLGGSPELEACQARHSDAITQLRGKCVRFFSSAER